METTKKTRVLYFAAVVALKTSQRLRLELEELQKAMPEDVPHTVVEDLEISERAEAVAMELIHTMRLLSRLPEITPEAEALPALLELHTHKMQKP